MKINDIKIISEYPNTSKIKSPVIVIFNVKVNDNYWESHTEYRIQMYYPMIKNTFYLEGQFKTFRKALNVAEKIASITNAEIVKEERNK